jgi:hypothetical protein
VALTTHPYLAPRLKEEYRYTALPLMDFRGLLYGEFYIYFTGFIRNVSVALNVTDGLIER